LAVEARILSAGPVNTHAAVPVCHDSFLKLSGIGPERAATAARNLIELGAGALLSWGIAAGLAADMVPGCLIIPETIMDSQGGIYGTDAAWRERVAGCLGAFLTVSNGTLVQSDAVVTQERDKVALTAAAAGAVAMDMESAAVAAAARAAGIPFLALRAVSDSVRMIIPPGVLEAVDEFGRVRPLQMMIFLARHPGEIAGLIRLGRGCREACRTLRAAAGEGSVFFPAGRLRCVAGAGDL